MARTDATLVELDCLQLQLAERIGWSMRDGESGVWFVPRTGRVLLGAGGTVARRDAVQASIDRMVFQGMPKDPFL